MKQRSGMFVFLGRASAVLLLLCGAWSGCRTSPTRAEFDAAFEPLLASGTRVEGWTAWSGDSRAPEALLESAYFRVDGAPAFATFWRQHAPESAPLPDVDFARETLLVVVLTRSAVTRLEFAALVRADDGRYRAYFAGDTTPLTRPARNFPYCIVRLPVVDRPITIEMVYTSVFDGTWRLDPRGERAEIAPRAHPQDPGP